MRMCVGTTTANRHWTEPSMACIGHATGCRFGAQGVVASTGAGQTMNEGSHEASQCITAFDARKHSLETYGTLDMDFSWTWRPGGGDKLQSYDLKPSTPRRQNSPPCISIKDRLSEGPLCKGTHWRYPSCVASPTNHANRATPETNAPSMPDQ